VYFNHISDEWRLMRSSRRTIIVAPGYLQGLPLLLAAIKCVEPWFSERPAFEDEAAKLVFATRVKPHLAELCGCILEGLSLDLVVLLPEREVTVRAMHDRIEPCPDGGRD